MIGFMNAGMLLIVQVQKAVHERIFSVFSLAIATVANGKPLIYYCSQDLKKC